MNNTVSRNFWAESEKDKQTTYTFNRKTLSIWVPYSFYVIATGGTSKARKQESKEQATHLIRKGE